MARVRSTRDNKILLLGAEVAKVVELLESGRFK
jgi:hypothetical protein